jgi:hypothetical protein
MADPDNGWKFAQCFGDKGEVEDVTEGLKDTALDSYIS